MVFPLGSTLLVSRGPGEYYNVRNGEDGGAVFAAGPGALAVVVSHYPLGRDATVNYGSYDLKFRNDTPNWILLKTTFSGWSLNVSLYSAPLKRKVTSTVSAPYGQTKFTTVKKPDATLAEGKTSVETPGVNGWSIDCFRKVYDAEGKLIHNDVFKSVYRMVPQVVLVGTKAVSPSPSASKKPSPRASPSGD